MLDTIGCTDRMLARGRKSDKSYVRKGKELLLTSDFEPLATKTQFPYTLILPQNQTEGVLIERLSELGKQVVRSKKVVSVQENEKGTHYDVVFEDEKSIKARYVVGCDGNKSSVSPDTLYPGIYSD